MFQPEPDVSRRESPVVQIAVPFQGVDDILDDRSSGDTLFCQRVADLPLGPVPEGQKPVCVRRPRSEGVDGIEFLDISLFDGYTDLEESFGTGILENEKSSSLGCPYLSQFASSPADFRYDVQCATPVTSLLRSWQQRSARCRNVRAPAPRSACEYRGFPLERSVRCPCPGRVSRHRTNTSYPFS